MATKTRTKNFGDVIRAKLAANPELAEAVEQHSFNADIAQQVHDLRIDAKLTQTQLAELAGTYQSVISRIEDADYDGHSLASLNKIAKALNRKLKVEFCAKPVWCDAKVTEFPLTWSTQGQWQTIIVELAETVPVPLDLSGTPILTSQSPTTGTGTRGLMFTQPQIGTTLVKI
jgi:transcriptional regulator with XRE-family HTH domain